LRLPRFFYARGLPRALGRMPGMTSTNERKCLYDAARRIEPFGEIVDLGSWLGSLTASLAAGLLKNPSHSGKTTVYAYDTFVWRDWMTPLATKYGITGYSDGESFLPRFLAETERWKSVIEVRPGDVGSLHWTGSPISILVIDAMKDEQTAKAIVSSFFPSLVAGKSLVFQQDFAHFYTSWIHLIWWRLRSHLELIEDLPRSGGSMYRYVREIPADAYSHILDLSSADDAEWERAFANSRRLVLPEKAHMVAAAEVMRLLHAGRGKDAAAMAERHYAEGRWGTEFELVMKLDVWRVHASKYFSYGPKRNR
jgi:hypothetical protein